MRSLLLVVWKNIIIRKRHYILTLCECTIPTLLFLLIAYARSKVDGLHKMEVSTATIHSPEPLDFNVDVDSTLLFYAPNNNFTSDIIKRVQDKLQLYSNNIKGFNSQEDLITYYKTHHNKIVTAIVFNEKAKSLEYSVRNYDKDFLWRTTELYEPYNHFGTEIDSDYNSRGFLIFQMALDTAYIEKMSNKDLSKQVSVSLELFPFPPYKADSAVTDFFLNYLPYITLFSFIFLCPSVLKRVVEEKQSGIKELMKIMGLKPWMLWLGWFIHGIVPITVSIVVIVVLMKVPMFGVSFPPIEYTHFSILFVFLFLYCAAAMAFCFAISTIFTIPVFAMVFGILAWILTFVVPSNLIRFYKLSHCVQILIGLLPNMVLHYGYSTISVYERRELGVQWNNFYIPGGGGGDEFSMAGVLAMLIFDIFFYMVITFYIDSVRPGPFGIAKPIFYPIRNLAQLMKWKMKTNEVHVNAETLSLASVEEGGDLKKGIQIHNLCKKFGYKVVVDDLCLDIYKDQITVLLGHNGAGKSTTIAMMTGMIHWTHGEIIVNGKNIKESMDDFRRNLGVCPQHNLLFRDLTVLEHLKFFAALKGKDLARAEIEARELLEKFNLQKKCDDMAYNLSGGMKRKLCLAMAMIGNSKILILDEPTSGMDVESRRELWDILLKWRRSKTILIVTHFMEEADVLGDRVAIMANGKLQCYGTPMYLKEKYKTGYHLNLIVNQSTTADDIAEITRYIKKDINDVMLSEVNGQSVVYVLPIVEKKNFSRLFVGLERCKDRLKIDHMSITITTLEDVFLKTKSVSSNSRNSEEFSTNSSQTTSRGHFCRKVLALSFKRLHYLKRKYMIYLVSAIIACVIFILSTLLSKMSSDYSGVDGTPLPLNLSIYGTTTTFCNGTENLSKIYKNIVANQQGIAHESSDVVQAIITQGIDNVEYYKKHMVVSAEFNKNGDAINAVALYSNIALHSAPISLNLVMNSIAKSILGEEYSISVNNWPLPLINTPVSSSEEISELQFALLWLLLIPTGILFFVGSFILFPNLEHSTNFLQIQLMSGLTPLCYWLTNLLLDLLICLPVIVGIILGWAIVWPGLNKGHEYGVLLLITIVYMVANLPFSYLLSRKESPSGGFALLMIFDMTFGIILTIIVSVLLESGDDYYTHLGNVLKYLFMLVIPHFGLTITGVEFSRKAVENYNWNIMSQSKQNLVCRVHPNPCCGDDVLECSNYQSFHSVLMPYTYMTLISAFMYFSINVFLDSYYFKYLVAKFFYLIGNPQKICQHQTKVTDNPEGNQLEVHNLEKSFGNVKAVNNISFTCKKGQCLGLLGVNGAGKTSTFRMLTRDLIQNSGSIYADKCADNKIEYMMKLGYCPQNDSLNFVLTGREILTFIGELRGLEQDQLHTTVDSFIKMFELEQYADKPCGTYSGGNKRKLSLAIALIGFPPYVLLDEPTNGVDPSSRRNFWNTIKDIKSMYNVSFILTSHSMAECEALCDTVHIMKSGTLKKKGTVAELKKSIGGFTVMMKINREVATTNESACELPDGRKYDVTDGDESTPVVQLKEELEIDSKWELKDEHSGLLHYYIKNVDMSLNTLFEFLEQKKSKFSPLIEDYSVSEATLEDVFLEVAKDTK